MAPAGDRRVVYSTDGGSVRYCKRCGQPVHEGRCVTTTPADTSTTVGGQRMPNDGVVRIARDRKGRGGKTMTVITGLSGDEAALAALAQTLKRLCGSGGTAKDGVIEIQGDHREKLAAHLTKLGHRVKLAGG